MKKLMQLFALFLVCLQIFSLCLDVYALHKDVLPDFKQVVAAGSDKTASSGDVVVSKTIKETKIENYFDITLEINSKEKVSEIIDTYNLAVVFVIDRSFTMSEKNSDGETRWAQAADAVVDISKKFTELEGVRMAAVGFSGGRKATGGGAETAYNDTVLFRDFTDPETDNKAFTLAELGGSSNWDNDRTYTGGTNIEAGLYHAGQLFKKLPKSVHKKIILLSDGVPTFYYDSNGMTQGPGNSDTSDKISQVPDCRDQAISMAESLEKTYGADIYTIGYEMDALDHVFGKYNEQDLAEETLKGVASQDNQFYPDGTTKTIKNVFTSIYNKIKEFKETIIDVSWVVSDPINNPDEAKYIQFIGFPVENEDGTTSYKNSLTKSANGDTASYSSSKDKITWNLKKSNHDTRKTIDGVKYYTYRIKYRVRLENENAGFSISGKYYTNHTTTLTYCVITNGILSNNKNITFTRPRVVGYKGTFQFYKRSSLNDTALNGAVFELTHHADCPCKKTYTSSSDRAGDNELKFTVTSGINATTGAATTKGLVKFANIPSGHTYLLTEKTAPADHNINSTTYKIKIAYGEVTGLPTDGKIINDIKTGTLVVRKELDGNTDNDRMFNVKIEAWHSGKALTGGFRSKYNTNGTEFTFNLGTDVIQLDKNDRIYIYDLPVGTTFKITELTTDGYVVKYQLGDGTKTLTPAVCDSSNSCRLETGTTTVRIYNYAEYEMPATGSSSQLIFGIIGILLLVGPVIYIGYSFYRERIVS